MIRSITLALTLLISSMALGANPSPKCLPGTTPNRYKVTYSNGYTVILNQSRDSNNVWVKDDLSSGASIQVAHGAWPGSGMFSVPSHVAFRELHAFSDAFTGAVLVTPIRDGAGPWTFPIKNIYGQTVSNVTIIGIP